MSLRLDVGRLRSDFSILERSPDDEPFIYLDSAATSLKPRQVIAALASFYDNSVGTVYRGVHQLGTAADERYRAARRTVAALIGAGEDEIVFVRNSTEALNLVALAHPAVARGRVVTTVANHHSSLLPWTARTGSTVSIGLTGDGTLDLEELARALSGGAGMLVLPQVANALGLRLPVRAAAELARQAGSLLFVDGAQSVPHLSVDVDDLGADFLSFSGHKMLAPFGIGVLWGRRELLEALEPLFLGGGMVESFAGGKAVPRPVPERLEAGTPNIGGAVALAAAVDYLETIGLDAIEAHVSGLARLARSALRELDGVIVYGPAADDQISSAVTFGLPGMAAHALARMLSLRFGIMVRSGYHCAQPLHESLGWPETVRASFYLYNTREEVAALVAAIRTIRDSIG